MSIIYKALQKTQKNREKENQIILSDKPKGKNMKYTVLIIVMAIALLFAYFPNIKLGLMGLASAQWFSHDVKSSGSQYVLNGVFISNKTKMAMINNHYYYYLGDSLDGMRIDRITQKDVKLSDDNQAIVLEVPA